MLSSLAYSMISQFDFRILADVNASLNALALVLIISGLLAIKRGNEELHKKLMLSAAAVSAIFLVSYLAYHLNGEPVKYQGEGALRIVYFTILISHVILAAIQVPLIILSILWGLQNKRAKHLKVAKITAPIWLYVSFTGVIVYLMLYRL